MRRCCSLTVVWYIDSCWQYMVPGNISVDVFCHQGIEQGLVRGEMHVQGTSRFESKLTYIGRLGCREYNYTTHWSSGKCPKCENKCWLPLHFPALQFVTWHLKSWMHDEKALVELAQAFFWRTLAGAWSVNYMYAGSIAHALLKATSLCYQAWSMIPWPRWWGLLVSLIKMLCFADSR